MRAAIHLARLGILRGYAYGTVRLPWVAKAWEAESVRARQAPQARGRLAGKDATSYMYRCLVTTLRYKPKKPCIAAWASGLVQGDQRALCVVLRIACYALVGCRVAWSRRRDHKKNFLNERDTTWLFVLAFSFFSLRVGVFEIQGFRHRVKFSNHALNSR